MTDIRRPILRRALALAVGTVLLAGAAAPCTLAVISGKAARNGRPLMWKNRDTSTLDNKLMSLRGPKYAFTAVVDAGDADGAEVAEVLGRLWGGDETLIVISSDLSHYMDYASARAMDAQTTRAIEGLHPEAIGYHQACGRIPVAGLLQEARRRGLQARTLDLRNSGDTAGPKDRVVGYGAYAVG